MAEFKPGDRAILTKLNRYTYGFEVGERVIVLLPNEVTESYETFIKNEKGTVRGYALTENLKPVNGFSPGDKVRLLSHRATGGFEIGGIYEIEGVKTYNGEYGNIIYSIRNGDGIDGFVRADNVEKVETVKRAAKAGERILIVDARDFQNSKPYRNGTVMRVEEVSNYNCVHCYEYKNVHLGEYEVIVEGTSNTHESSDELTELKTKVTSLESKLDVLQSKVSELESVKREIFVYEPKTNNQLRKETIQAAKDFTSEVETKAGSFYNNSRGNYTFRVRSTDVEFVVNKEKRTVVALARGYISERVYSKGIAKCVEGDVFNEHIGKAIAVARAYELDIPEEILNAPQPDEKVEGMYVYIEGENRELVPSHMSFMNLAQSPNYACCVDSTFGEEGIIVEDTHAKY